MYRPVYNIWLADLWGTIDLIGCNEFFLIIFQWMHGASDWAKIKHENWKGEHMLAWIFSDSVHVQRQLSEKQYRAFYQLFNQKKNYCFLAYPERSCTRWTNLGRQFGKFSSL